MNDQQYTKITEQHLQRKAAVYLRQSSTRQTEQNLESQRLQYAMAQRASALGFTNIETIDCDLGFSASVGAAKREGFDSLISSVARGEVGIILSRELSRLSRTDKDWCHLLEVCQIFGTLIGDEQQVYDLNLLDDQLVLGIKGTMSVAELKVLKMRMLQGSEEKARRGELLKRLPSGYSVAADGSIVKNPDKRVQEAIMLVFDKFRELWSVRQTFKWFHEHNIEIPANLAQGGKGLVWKLPRQSFIRDILGNPFYAGAYVYGRRQQETVFVDGKLRKRVGRLRKPHECRVFIQDHHEGYIGWETYEENQKIISNNCVKSEGNDAVGAVRSGSSLLVGLLRCGHCGRRIHSHYSAKHGKGARYLCKGTFDSGGNYCIGFAGGAADRRLSQEILNTISPLGIKASIQAACELSAVEDERLDALRLQLEQLEYEARRAFEQYNEADPRNRLVAAELERRWNTKLEQIEATKSRISAYENEVRHLSEPEIDKIRKMGTAFEEVWHGHHCPAELKKKIARTLIKEIIASDTKDNTLHFVIHWQGGIHTEITMKKPPSAAQQKTSMESLDVIRKMAIRYGDDQIAAVLNKLGHKTGKGKRWDQARVKSARRSYSIDGQQRTCQDPEILTLSEAARHCAVSPKTLEKLAQHGFLTMQQITKYAPWEIRRADLETEPLKSMLEHLRNTGKLVLGRGSSSLQISLPLKITGDDNDRYYE